MKTSLTTSPGISALRPPRIFFGCVLVSLIADIFLPTTASPLATLPLSIRLITGLGILGSGFTFMMWAHTHFTSVGTAIKTWEPASELVTEGAFRHSRNPMYVGFVAILLGGGIAIENLPMMLSAVIMFLFLDRYVIPREEIYLRHRFDKAYTDYLQNVRRWL